MTDTGSSLSVILRALEPEDIDILYSLENSHSPGDGVTVPISRHALRMYIESTRYDAFADSQLRMVVEYCSRAVGLVDLYEIDSFNRTAKVAISIIKEFCNQGLGRLALNEMISYAKINLGLKSLLALVSVNNIASKHLFADKFTKVGTLYGWVSNTDVDLYQIILN